MVSWAWLSHFIELATGQVQLPTQLRVEGGFPEVDDPLQARPWAKLPGGQVLAAGCGSNIHQLVCGRQFGAPFFHIYERGGELKHLVLFEKAPSITRVNDVILAVHPVEQPLVSEFVVVHLVGGGPVDRVGPKKDRWVLEIEGEH